mmetsp:Transcript_45205/g.119773  ORF Transcript_45205/g.119773 Transcript_45205/m.119773 type:complete len:231 (-) Transcript_45205:326-1018(-)
MRRDSRSANMPPSRSGSAGARAALAVAKTWSYTATASAHSESTCSSQPSSPEKETRSALTPSARHWSVPKGKASFEKSVRGYAALRRRRDLGPMTARVANRSVTREKRAALRGSAAFALRSWARKRCSSAAGTTQYKESSGSRATVRSPFISPVFSFRYTLYMSFPRPGSPPSILATFPPIAASTSSSAPGPSTSTLPKGDMSKAATSLRQCRASARSQRKKPESSASYE